jgi:Nucleotidyl transferase AbiEii toxin, Type IV TA system
MTKMTAPIHQSRDSASPWTAATVGMNWDILDRMERAVAKVRERLLRATAALNQVGVSYAVVGGNAVASWVATVDEGAVRNTRDIDLLVRRSDLPAIAAALEQAGFVRDEVLDVVMFRDGAEGKPSEAVHLLFAGERTRPDHPLPAPEIQTVKDPANFRVLTLESLVTMKLMSNRDKDRTHLRDLIGVRLIDSSWLPRLPPALADRLKQILDTPDR